jgi:hypothetical protein
MISWVTTRSPTAITWHVFPHSSAMYSLKQLAQLTPDLIMDIPMPMPEPHTTIPLSSALIWSPIFYAKSG